MDPIWLPFVVSLLSIAAELGHKTQLGLIMLTASMQKPRAIFLGMISEYTFVAGLGVLAGQALLAILPMTTLTIISGMIFVALGLLMLRVDLETTAARVRSASPFYTASVMIVLTELGDKTQIVTIALAARFAQPVAVFSGVLLAFVIIDGMSILLAGRLGKRLPISKVKKASALIFVILGILTLAGLL